jgi:hypothetical protein
MANWQNQQKEDSITFWQEPVESEVLRSVIKIGSKCIN